MLCVKCFISTDTITQSLGTSRCASPVESAGANTFMSDSQMDSVISRTCVPLQTERKEAVVSLGCHT